MSEQRQLSSSQRPKKGFSTAVFIAASTEARGGIITSAAVPSRAYLAAADTSWSEGDMMKEAPRAGLLEDAAREQGRKRGPKVRFSPTGHVQGESTCMAAADTPVNETVSGAEILEAALGEGAAEQAGPAGRR